jgi:hypothetical protein
MKDAQVLTLRRKAKGKGIAVLLAAVLLAGVGSCSPTDGQDWYGYYYADVFSNAPAQVSGPYDGAPPCVAAMQARLRQAPTTAGFTCARQCHPASDGSVGACRAVAR